MHAPSNRRWLVSSAGGLLACLIAAGCASNASSAAPPPDQPASTGADASASGPAASSPAPATISPTSTPAGVENLLISPPVRRELTAAYEAYMRFKPSLIAGTVSNSVYYAYDATTDVYWAMATFQPTAAALRGEPGSPAFNELVNMQDGGNQALFTRTENSPWQMERGGVPWECQVAKFFPKAVIKVWALNLPRCPAAG